MSKKFALVTEYSEVEIKAIISTAVEEALTLYNSQLNLSPANSPPSPDVLLSRKEVCRLLRLSLPTIAKLQKDGKLKASIVGNSYRYSQKQIKELLNNGGAV